ncbi:MAG: alpha/beta hydrolase-fold protein [Psychroserpens sp.]|uniref:alpha/beta hydrolase-fold protein n=1 Tax=Psychroserpens sp. TaxID=2020870 RepID=UPI0030013804
MKQLINFILYCFISITCVAQVENSDIKVGVNHTIKSSILNQDRGIQIYVPDSYAASEKEYPVLYVLDGQEYFLHGIAYQNMLRFRDKSPEFIIVGIKTDRRTRRVLFLDESDKFISFLETELIPYIDTVYRTKKEKERLYFGWEMGGGLGFEILTERNNLFSGFILASPSHATDKRMDALKKLKSDAIKSNKFLLVSAAPEEGWITKDTLFLSIIENKAKGKKPWRFKVFDREDHYTTPLKTIHEGLSDYFDDYKPIRLRSLKAYDDYGGLEALRAYYKKRGERYNLPIAIHKETRHFLIVNAMTEDNYERFNFYMEEFDDYISTISRDFWLNRYAKYYLKHKNTEKSKSLYDYGISKFSNSKLLYEGLGDVYVEINQPKKALIAYEKSMDIDSNQPELKSKIEALRH